MRCPWCGSEPVRITGNHWECGWCGDSGPIPCRILEQRKAAHEKQEAWWQEAAATARWAAQTITESAAELLPECKDAKALAWKAILCQVSAGLIESGLWNGTWDDEVDDSVIGRIFYPYRSLASDLADFSGISNRQAMERSVRSKKPLFQAEGQLTDKVCGKFWEMMIEQLPPYDKEDPSMQDGHLYMGRAFGGKNRAESAIEDALYSPSRKSPQKKNPPRRSRSRLKMKPQIRKPRLSQRKHRRLRVQTPLLWRKRRRRLLRPKSGNSFPFLLLWC